MAGDEGPSSGDSASRANTRGRGLHPGVEGRPAELAVLADAVRRLVGAAVTNRAPAETVASIAGELDALAERLESYVPQPPPPLTVLSVDGARGAGGLLDRMALDVVVGRYNPLALPLDITFDPPRAIGRGRFSLPYEGPPGCIHGAVIAASFDIVLTAANVIADAAGPTVRLALHYRRPTLLHDEAVFEAWVDRREGRRTFSVGRLVQNGVVTVEAEGEFAALPHRRTESLAQRQMGGSPEISPETWPERGDRPEGRGLADR
jgi:acyl-coenzyme A thioesterase PaaI-like protein